MCEHCEKKGLLTGMLKRAGVVAASLPQGAGGGGVTLSPALPAKPARRPKLWELEEKLHCPVIGTCLSLDEIARIARRLGFSGQIGDPYRLHVEAVSLSCSRNEASEAMHKLLERKFNLDVARFKQLHNDAAVLAQWKSCLERGEVAGPMWAALSHKLASAETRRQVYADVHMLSHQVGAGQAADLRRLEWLEREHASLRAELAEARVASQRQKEAEQSSAARAEQFERERDSAREQAEQLARRVGFLESGQAMVALGRRLLLAEAQAARTLELEARFKELARKVGILRAERVRLSRELDEAASERDALERLWLEGTSEAKACGGDRSEEHTSELQSH